VVSNLSALSGKRNIQRNEVDTFHLKKSVLESIVEYRLLETTYTYDILVGRSSAQAGEFDTKMMNIEGLIAKLCPVVILAAAEQALVLKK